MSNSLSLIKALSLSAVLSVTAAKPAYPDCMSTNTIALIGSGFDFPEGPYVEFAISHGWINGTTLVQTGAGSLCGLAPFPISLLCGFSVAANILWIKLEDQGFGVFVKFHYLWGVWAPTSATSICQAQPISCSNPITCTGAGGETYTACLQPGALCPGTQPQCPPGEALNRACNPPVCGACPLPPGGSQK
jgi:hypothetical protein